MYWSEIEVIWKYQTSNKLKNWVYGNEFSDHSLIRKLNEKMWLLGFLVGSVS